MINQVTLNRLIQVLMNHNITCGVGGSYLLQLYGLYDDPDDVDFWILPEDIKKVKDLFNEYEEIKEKKIQLPAEYRFKMLYDDIKVDFVACFMVKPNKHQYVYNILPDNVKIVETEGGYRVPCTSLEDWYIVYKLLKKEKKAQLIEKYIAVSFGNEILEKVLESGNNILPLNLTKNINETMWKNSQQRLFG